MTVWNFINISKINADELFYLTLRGKEIQLDIVFINNAYILKSSSALYIPSKQKHMSL